MALLPTAINNIRIGRIDGWLVSITKKRYPPIGIAQTMIMVGARGAVLGVVILRATNDVIKGFVVVHGYFVELGQRQICCKFPIPAPVPRFINATVASGQQIVWIMGVKGQCVVVHMLVLFTNILKSLAAVVGVGHLYIHEIDQIKFVGAGENLSVVVGTRSPGHLIAALLPAFAAVG